MHARDIKITGIVQGVGMRPTIMRHAIAANIKGWVLNSVGGVHIHALGSTDALDDFEARLKSGFPPQARIEHYESYSSKIEDEDKAAKDFYIKESDAHEKAPAFVSPDIATCKNCCEDFFDPENRRYHYPFTNCTDCGPRYTVIHHLPYDRAQTSMSKFKMCPECQAEYDSYLSRRHHAQPNACFMCGPQVEWIEDTEHLSVSASELADRRRESDAILERCADALIEGKVIAIKGLGGYHLACDATNSKAVQALRERKKRSNKALAVMMPNLEMVKDYASVNNLEEEVLSGTIRPIVLLKLLGIDQEVPQAGNPKRALASEVYGELVELGVMLPYTPLHHLLLDLVKRPLVMTSANISEEPLVKDEDEAFEKLSHIADAYLIHDRPILQRIDDSVVRVLDGKLTMIRRARGYAPGPFEIPEHLQKDALILGVGPEQKSTFTLSRHNTSFVSEHIGDLENLATLQTFEERIEAYERLLNYSPDIITQDMHPEYLSSKYALERGKKENLQRTLIQHHSAHIASVLAEHACKEKVLGVALDGTGLGDDNTLWGGEIFVGDYKKLERLCHLRHLKLPSGSAAIKEPWRIAAFVLHDTDFQNHPAAKRYLENLPQETYKLLCGMVKANINTPSSCSAGRLFDAVSALLGLCPQTTYEGEAAIVLEAFAHKLPRASRQQIDTDKSFEVYSLELKGEELDYRPLIRAVLDDMEAGTDVKAIAYKIHKGISSSFNRYLIKFSKDYTIKTIALSGGCFMNRLLLEEMSAGLTEAGLTVLTNRALPANDGGISYGQICFALAQLP